MGSGKRSRSLLSLALAVPALGLSVLGCGISGSTAQTGHAPTSAGAAKKPAYATATKRSGGLTVALTAMPPRAKADSTVQFEVMASERHALGALGYRLRYGDGTTAANVVPMFCLAGKGAPVRQTWRLSHRYGSPGRYTVSLTVYVNCTSEHVTTTVTVSAP